jgi:hypothetical protein
MCDMDEELAKEILRKVKELNGRTYKQKIRWAWMSGNYRGELNLHGLGVNIESDLQRIRNTLGPSWLHRVRV